MYPPHVLARIMAENIRKSGTPLGIPALKLNTWWSGESRESDTMLFTGLMYQMVPYIAKLTRIMLRFEGRIIERFISAFSSFSAFRFLRVDERDVQYFNSLLIKISELLHDSGIDYFYDSELDHYSGVLLYEIGDDRGFADHASLVAEKLSDYGVRKVITVDPHTTYALKVLYPQFTGIRFEVKSYLELLRLGEGEESGDEKSWKVTIHEPCYYARHLEMSDVLRNALQRSGIECVNIRNSGRLTSCCGGPVESISPKLSLEISRNRYYELKSTGCDVVTACPICLGNFRGFGEVKDVTEVLWERRKGHDRS